MDWIIGDIHGMLVPLQALVTAVRHEDSEAAIYFVGDYVNRGPDSRGVIELLFDLPTARCVRGNHDDLLDLILNGNCLAPACCGADPVDAFVWFTNHGLLQTFLSYGASQEQLERMMQYPSARRLQELCDLVPATHKAFFADLPTLRVLDNFFVAHARWPESVPPSPRLDLDPILQEMLLWGRWTPAQLHTQKNWPSVGYFGHTPVPNYRSESDIADARDLYLPIVAQQMVLIDTASALNPLGQLTAWCHQTGSYLQADRAGNVLLTENIPDVWPGDDNQDPRRV